MGQPWVKVLYIYTNTAFILGYFKYVIILYCTVGQAQCKHDSHTQAVRNSSV